MHRIGTLNLGAAGGNDSLRLKNLKKGRQVKELRLRVNGLVTVGGGGGTPGTSDLISMLNKFFARVDLKHGPDQGQSMLASLTGGDVRQFQRFMTQNEVTNDFVGIAGQGTAAAHTWVASLRLLFQPEWQKGSRRRYPGATQLSMAQLEVQEDSAGFSGAALTLTRTAGVVTVEVYAVYERGPDTVAPIVSIRRINQARLDLQTPDGLVLAVFDRNAVHDSTVIQNYRVDVGDELALYDAVRPREVGETWRSRMDAGGSDPLDLWTLMYAVDPGEDSETWPTGPVTVTLVAQDVATQQGFAIYYPALSEGDQREHFKAVSGALDGKPVLATVEPPTHPDAAPGAAAFFPAVIRKPGSNAFASKPGILATPEGTQVVVPDAHKELIRSAVSAGGGAKGVLAGRMAQQLAQQVPGALGSDGSRSGAAAIAINELVDGLGATPTDKRS